MQSYNAITDFIHDHLTKFSLSQQTNFVKNLIYQFSKTLTENWLDNELDSEKPHYQTIFNQITSNHWQADSLKNSVIELDNIMLTMGVNYPHTTGEDLLLILELLPYWFELNEHAQKDTHSDQLVVSACICLLDHFEEQAETRLDTTISYENWLNYPETTTGFAMINTALQTCQKP
ncbi:hypothetical protein MOMA_08541 [Moraxella macacae 0408225]|uniref:Uncharacterized protein n=1 Tax=Moraxella macacae 0408225 TaxID=1230338 RepID=L2F770_9GAMM|nr:hypothetical protein [Moraxella macacae]ELA08596.1 hypothetical protein MOMA_08541 [Moraxella macacae 0408225]